MPTVADPVLLGGRYRLGPPLTVGVTGVLHTVTTPTGEVRWAQVLPRPERRRRLGDRWFVAGARQASSLSGLDVVGVLDHGCQDHMRWLLVAHRPERTLADQLAAGRHGSHLLPALVQALHGLAELHREGLAHGGVRPESVWLNGERGVLADLLLDARELGLPPSALPLAPERTRGEPRSPEADVFAAGALIWWVFTGDAPDETLPRWQGQLPRWVYQICRRCMARDPGRRFGDADALLEALQAARTSTPEEAPELPEPRDESPDADASVLIEGWARRAWQGMGQVVLLTGPDRSGRSWLVRHSAKQAGLELLTVDLAQPGQGLVKLCRRLLDAGRLRGQALEDHLVQRIERLAHLDKLDLPMLVALLDRPHLPRGWASIAARVLISRGLERPTCVLLAGLEHAPPGIDELFLLVAERLCTRSDVRLLLAGTWTTPSIRPPERMVERLERWPNGRIKHLHAMNAMQRERYCVGVLGMHPTAAAWLAQQGKQADTLADAFVRASAAGRLVPSPAGWQVVDPSRPLEALPDPSAVLTRLIAATSLPVAPFLVSIAALGGRPSLGALEALWRGLGPSGERTWQSWVPTADLLFKEGVLQPGGTSTPRVALASAAWQSVLLEGSRLVEMGQPWLEHTGTLLTRPEAPSPEIAVGARLLCLGQRAELARERLLAWSLATAREGHPAEAAETLTTGLELLGEDAELRLVRAALLAQTGELAEAREELLALRGLDQAEPEVTAVLLAELPDAPLAERIALIDAVEPPTGRGPWPGLAWARARAPLTRARLLLDQGQLADAEHALALALPGPGRQLMLGRAALLRGRSQQAREHLEPLLDAPRVGADARMLFSTALVRLGHPLQALRQARQALREALVAADEQRVTVAEMVLLDVLVAAGRLPWASQVSLPILVRARGGADDGLLGIALLYRARLYRQLGQPERALTSVRQAMPFLDRIGSWWRWEAQVQELWLLVQLGQPCDPERGRALVQQAQNLGLRRLELRARVVTAWLCRCQALDPGALLADVAQGDLDTLVDPDLMTAAFTLLQEHRRSDDA